MTDLYNSTTSSTTTTSTTTSTTTTTTTSTMMDDGAHEVTSTSTETHVSDKTSQTITNDIITIFTKNDKENQEISSLYTRSYSYLLTLIEVLRWLISKIKESNSEKIEFESIMIQYELGLSRFVGVVICNSSSTKKILDILKQPPGEYKGKYIAMQIPSESSSNSEPIVVQEIQKTEKRADDEDSSEGEIEVEVDDGECGMGDIP